MQDLSVVNKSLLELESELGLFKSAKDALQSAQGEAKSILKRWEQIRDAQDEAIKQLYGDTVKHAELSGELIGQMQELYERLNKVAVAVEKVDYPARLDKLDANISTVTLTMQGLQNRIDLYEKNFNRRLERLNAEIEASIAAVMQTVHSLEGRVDASEREINGKIGGMRSDIVSAARSSKDTITAMLRGEAESTRQVLLEEVRKTRKSNQIGFILIMLALLGCIAVVSYGLLLK